MRISLAIVIGLVMQYDRVEAYPSEPVAILLTWQQDPTTTMTLDWHITPEDDGNNELRFREINTEVWGTAIAEIKDFPHSDRKINRVELTGLDPETYYEFYLGEFERKYKFRTMPKNLSEPIRFITGGDTDHARHQMSAMAMQYDPDFIYWGGDYAYVDGDPAKIERWYGWFEGIKENLISDKGRVVPIIMAIGNHELFRSKYLTEPGRYPHGGMSEEEAETYMEKHELWEDKVTFFYDLFAFPGDPAYNVLDFGNYLSLVVLDSDHSSQMAGIQTEWLTQTLSERNGRPHIFPIYHEPMYPSRRNFYDNSRIWMRENWAPLFEQHGVRVSFENHDHIYKRTLPIRNGEVASNGIVFIGDGNWGRGFRDSDNRDEWYIKELAHKRHGIVVTLQGTHQHFLVVGEHGEVIDEYPRRPVPKFK